MDSTLGHSNVLDSETDEEGTALVLAQNVKRLRLKARINKRTFALMVGIGRPFLNKIESGLANPRLSIIVKMAEALDTTPLALLADPVDSAALPPRKTGLLSEAQHTRLF